jgi:D-3-phosphoglycerate dehydrogenase
MLLLNLEPKQFSEKAIAEVNGLARYRALPVEAEKEETLFWKEVAAANVIWTRLGRQLDNTFFSHAPNLRAIVSATTGLNHIDTDEARRLGVEIVSLKGDTEFLSTVTATAELTLSLMLEAMRHTGRANHSVVHGHNWDRDRFRGQQLSGKTIGIIGMGRLGRIVAEYAAALRMNILYADIRDDALPPGNIRTTRTSIETLLSTSDIVSLHVDFTSKNRYMLAADAFRLMQRHAWLINTARGELLDEAALLEALENAIIGGAALDVLEDETRVTSQIAHHPLIAYASRHDNLILTPHIGGACDDAMALAELHAAKKLAIFLNRTG